MGLGGRLLFSSLPLSSLRLALRVSVGSSCRTERQQQRSLLLLSSEGIPLRL